EALVGSGRAYVREATRDLWDTVCRRETPSTTQRAVYRLAVAQAYANASQAVDLMYNLAGATAIYARSRLDRCLRDVHTAAAHVWVAPDTYELAGRLLLGLDPGSPNISSARSSCDVGWLGYRRVQSIQTNTEAAFCSSAAMIGAFMVNRRGFIRSVSAGLVGAPLVAHAQSSSKVYRIGYIFTEMGSSWPA